MMDIFRSIGAATFGLWCGFAVADAGAIPESNEASILTRTRRYKKIGINNP